MTTDPLVEAGFGKGVVCLSRQEREWREGRGVIGEWREGRGNRGLIDWFRGSW